jgi:hypothetical protein
MPELIASRTQRYATRMLKAGDPFSASNRDARLLVALKRASPAPRERSMEELQAEAEGPGIHVDKRWGRTRLLDEIAAKKSADAAG